MKLKDALHIISHGYDPGYMVAFHRKVGSILTVDYFPEKGEESLIETEEEAWRLARAFAYKTVGKCVDIYVIHGDTFCPVVGYEARKINNRTWPRIPKFGYCGL